MSVKKFPTPWQIERADPDTFIVMDASGTKLFYIAGDEGDGDEALPSALFHTSDRDHSYLLKKIIPMIESIK